MVGQKQRGKLPRSQSCADVTAQPLKKATLALSLYCILKFKTLLKPSITYLYRAIRSAITMSFETTTTIASFGGKLLKLKHKSSSTNTDMALNLYLPPQALKSGGKVPVLFYLSGLTCTGDNCSEKGFFQHGASEKGIAIVYPDTSPRRSTYRLLIRSD